jgi:hypothetical protein
MALPVAVIDAIPDVAQGALPATQTLTETSIPGTGGISISTRAWSIVSKPSGSTVRFADNGAGVPGQTSTLASPVLEQIDAWGNYRIFLVVTDNLAASSVTDPLLAPDSAFGVKRVTSTNLDLQKLASGERNWSTHAARWVQEIEDNKIAFDARTVNGIADVSDVTSTGPHLDNLMDAGYATQNGLAGGTSLHKHAGSQMDAATTTDNGVVTLDETPVNAVNPKVLNNEYVAYTARIVGTQTAGGFLPGVVTVQDPAVGNEGHVGFVVRDAGTVTGWANTWTNGGNDSHGPAVKLMKLYKMTLTQWNANDYAGATLIDTITSTAPAVAYGPTYDYDHTLNVAVALRDVLAVVLDTDWTNAPTTSGYGLTVTIDVKRSV